MPITPSILIYANHRNLTSLCSTMYDCECITDYLYILKWLRIRLPNTGNKLITLVKTHVKIQLINSMIPLSATILVSVQAIIDSSFNPERTQQVKERIFFSIPPGINSNLLMWVNWWRGVRWWGLEKVWIWLFRNAIVLFDWTQADKRMELIKWKAKLLKI